MNMTNKVVEYVHGLGIANELCKFITYELYGNIFGGETDRIVLSVISVTYRMLNWSE